MERGFGGLNGFVLIFKYCFLNTENAENEFSA